MSDILKTQRSFALKAQAQPEHRFGDLYHLICRTEWIREALDHVLANTGARTAGVDGVSKKSLTSEEQQAAFIQALQADLKAGTYVPQPVKRVWIPKPGKSEKRGLGIPTIRDRVVQEMLRMLMEPIWESDFLSCSHGFRPGHRTMDCIAEFYRRVTVGHPRAGKFFWAIEGDIRKCFDRINQTTLLRLIGQRIADQRVVGLVKACLTAGMMEDGLFRETPEGTPQGGILSPLLANIYLHQLDLWWQRQFGNPYERKKRRQQGQGNAVLIRYADDFVLLWNGTHAGALALKAELKQFLWDELHLELSEEKTAVTHLKDGLDFLGFHIQWELSSDREPWLRVTPTRKNIQRFHDKIRAMTDRRTLLAPVDTRFKTLNRVITGWGRYYQHVSFSHDAARLDWWINERVLEWLMDKHKGKGVRWVLAEYKKREVRNGHNRWNLSVKDAKGETIYIAKLEDIRLRPYRGKRVPHPYLAAEEVPVWAEPETPFLEPHVLNLGTAKTLWREMRIQVMERDGHRCTCCGRADAALDVHHVVARRDGGTDEPANLVTLCEDCHGRIPTRGPSSKGEKVQGRAG